MFDITILTEDRYLDPLKKNWYTEQVLLEDEILFESLRKRGLVVTRKSWSDKNFDWSNTNFAIIRSTWDYFDKIDEFSQWLTNVKDKLVLINSFNLIKWNLNKSYLLDFSKKKINIASSIFVNSTNFITLKTLFNQTNWEEAIIKPAISGAAKNTFRVNNWLSLNFSPKLFISGVERFAGLGFSSYVNLTDKIQLIPEINTSFRNETELSSSLSFRYIYKSNKSIDFYYSNAGGIQDIGQLLKAKEHKFGIKVNLLF